VFFRLLASPLILLGTVAFAQTPCRIVDDTQQKPPDSDKTASQQVDSAQPDAAPRTPTIPECVEKIGNGVSAPIPIKTPMAKYSREARKKKIEGPCLVSVIIDAQGLPQNPRVIRAIGAGLDEEAITAIKKYRFKPAMKDGHPVAVGMTIQVNFRLY